MNDNFDKNQDEKIDKESLNQEEFKAGKIKNKNLDETFEEEKIKMKIKKIKKKIN